MKPQDDTEKYREELAWAQKVREIFIQDQLAQMRAQNRDESDIKRQERFLRGQRTAWPLVAWAKKYADEKHVTDADLEQVVILQEPVTVTEEPPVTRAREEPTLHREPAPEPNIETVDHPEEPQSEIQQLKAQIAELEKKSGR